MPIVIKYAGLIFVAATTISIIVLIVAGRFWFVSPRAGVLTVGSIKFRVEIADTDRLRSRGLAGHSNLASDEGMLFIFEDLGLHGFWMRGMEFPLDFIWIRDGRVEGIERNAPPDNSADPKVYFPPEPVDNVLEINAGMAEISNIKIGDKVYLLVN